MRNEELEKINSCILDVKLRDRLNEVISILPIVHDKPLHFLIHLSHIYRKIFDKDYGGPCKASNHTIIEDKDGFYKVIGLNGDTSILHFKRTDDLDHIKVFIDTDIFKKDETNR